MATGMPVTIEGAVLITAFAGGVVMIIREMRKSETRQIKDTAQRVVEANGTPLAFMNSDPFPAWYKDRDLKMRWLNDEYVLTFGVTAREYIDRTDFDIWPADVAEAFRVHDLKVLQSGVQIHTTEMVPARAKDPDAKRRAWRIIKFPVFDQVDKHRVVGVGGRAIPYSMLPEDATGSARRMSRMFLDDPLASSSSDAPPESGEKAGG